MAKRTIIIGDVHGCSTELDDLLAEIKPNDSDEIIFIGDLICKGPDSLGIWERYQKMRNAKSIIGNHEWSIREQYLGNIGMRPSFREMKKEFGKKFKPFTKDICCWPSYINRRNFLAVHAGLRPDLPPSQTDDFDLVSIRTWDGKGKNLQSAENPAWFKFYKDPKLVVFGHWASLGGIDKKRIKGIDTGCVYGGKLTALILPDYEYVSVPANKVYCKI